MKLRPFGSHSPFMRARTASGSLGDAGRVTYVGSACGTAIRIVRRMASSESGFSPAVAETAGGRPGIAVDASLFRVPSNVGRKIIAVPVTASNRSSGSAHNPARR